MVDVCMMIAHSWWGESHPGRSVDRARELVDLTPLVLDGREKLGAANRTDAVARYHRLRG